MHRTWAKMRSRLSIQDARESSSDPIGADTPIRSSSQDALQRGKFARRIAGILETPHVYDGRVFAIRAEWGAGKSSLKNLIIEELESRESATRWLEFNPWQWGDGDAISRALFLQMASKLGGQFSPGALGRARLLRQYGGLLLGAGGALKGADDDKFGMPFWLTFIGLATGALGIRLSEWMDSAGLEEKNAISWMLGVGAILVLLSRLAVWLGKDRGNEPLDEVRGDLEARLRKLERPLIVFVDDIDRLEPEQIRVLIRQVKVNANLPNIVFVLLFQPSIVIAALDPVSNGSGAEYLEKVVQANFDLPAAPREAIFKQFGHELDGLIGQLATPENGFQTVRWGNVLVGCIQPFLRNLRDVRRLLSSVAIHAPLHQGMRSYEVNLIDMLALETIRVFEPRVHTAIANNKTLLLQSTRFQGDGGDERNKVALQEILALCSPARRETTRSMIVELFPTAAGLLGGMHYGAEWRKDWLEQKRVCTDRLFDSYFELQVREGTLSESDFIAVLESSSKPEALSTTLAALRSSDLLPSLATRLDEAVQQLPLENIDALLPAMFELGGEMKAASDEPFNVPYISAWRAASWFLRRVSDPAERAVRMEAALRASDALSVPAVLLSLDHEAREKNDDKRELLFDDVGFDRLKSLWVEKAQALAADEDRLLSSDDMVSILYRWGDFAGSFDAPKAWVSRQAQRPNILPVLLERFVTVGRTHAMTDRVSSRMERFDKSAMEEFFDLPKLSAELATIDRKALTGDQNRILDVLKAALESWSIGGVKTDNARE